MECLSVGFGSGVSYTESVRQFCLKLHYYSPRAYEFVRSEFENHLPHLSTIKSWYRNCDLDSKSGISGKSLEILEKAALTMEKKNQQLIVSLSFDEMAIRKHQQWCNKTNQFYGSVTYGNSDEIATNAIVFFIKGVNTYIQIPVGYYFITNLGAESRKTLILQISAEILKRSVDISNITFDGLAANAMMCEMLGASFDPFDLKPYIIEPSKSHKINIILDPSHCIKLIRNNFASRGVLFNGSNEEITWKYISQLVDFSKSNNFGLTHKINKRHIDFQNRKMHVRTAVETLSNAVADSIEFLKDQNNEHFQAAAATIRFIRVFNSLFDVMNTQGIKHDHSNKLKSALNVFNDTEVLTFLKEGKKYILELKVKQGAELVPVVTSPIKTGFRGFLINIESVCAIYSKYVEEMQLMSMLPTYRLSQDHLEMLFHRIRARNGSNDNPTVLQFQSNYKRVQMLNDLAISNANIANIASLNILCVTSSTHKRNDTCQSIEEAEEFDIINLENIQQGEYLIDKCMNSGITFTAYSIEQRLLNCGQVYCGLCRKVLLENEKLDSRNCISDKIPCKSTFDICKLTDLAIKQYIGHETQSFRTKVFSAVLLNIDMDHIFSRFFYSDHDESHKSFLIQFIISEYIHIKCQLLSKHKTLAMHKKIFRQANRKTTHNAGQ